VLVLKLALVAGSIFLATLVSRRFGHAVGGVVAGMPMIAAPVCAILLMDQEAPAVRAIALGALVCIPGSVVHSVSIAWTSRRLHWAASVASGLALFITVGVVLTWLNLPPVLSGLVALAAPSLGLLLSPPKKPGAGRVNLPPLEFVLRLIAALVMAGAVILSADAFPAVVSGMLLAVPITGTVLPCFTLSRHGPEATAALMRGFVTGLHGFAAFFAALYLGLGVWNRLPAFALALTAACAVAMGVSWIGRATGRTSVQSL
jgi:hypothetical protein